MQDLTEAKKLVTYCGGFCGGCSGYKGRIIAMVARDFKELTAGYVEWLPKVIKLDFNYDDFIKGLEYFSKENSSCYCQAPCKEGGGAPCKIRPCAKEKGKDICYECKDFPCEHFDWILKGHPERLEEQKRFEKLGFEVWLKFHAERAKKGYASLTGKYYTRAKKQQDSKRYIER